MAPIDRHTPRNTKVAVCLFSAIFLVINFEIETAGAFLLPSHHLSPSTLLSNAYIGTSTLMATKEENIVPVTDSNYRDLFGGEKPLLLDAYAMWCGPCKLIEPVLEQCAEDWKDSLVVGKFDVGDAAGEKCKSRDLKVELILQGAMPQALPALILVHNNKVLETWKGVISPTQLEEMLERHDIVKEGHVERTRNSESDLPNEENSVVVNDVSNDEFKTINKLDKEKTRTFRGIGLVNRL